MCQSLKIFPNQAKFSKYWLSCQTSWRITRVRYWDQAGTAMWEDSGQGKNQTCCQGPWGKVGLGGIGGHGVGFIGSVPFGMVLKWKFRNWGSHLTIDHASMLWLWMFIYHLMKSGWGIWERRRCHRSVTQTVWVTSWATIHNEKEINK